jgi:hypothetical protein
VRTLAVITCIYYETYCYIGRYPVLIHLLSTKHSSMHTKSMLPVTGCTVQCTLNNTMYSYRPNRTFFYPTLPGCGCRDLRARLELAVEHLLDVSCTTQSCTREDVLPAARNNDIPTDSEFLIRSPEVTAVVRQVICIPAIIGVL